MQNTIQPQSKISLDVKENRHLYIGGSDIASVMGMSRYKTPLKLWAEKTQKIQLEDLSTIEAVELGQDLEEFVAQKFSQRTGKKVRRANCVYAHKTYPYMVAHIDRLVVGADEILECKTCSAFKKDEWNNEDIPQEYILQLMWYLGITGRKIGHIAVLIGGQSFKYKQIEFDEELFNQMVESAKSFWDMVQSNRPPMCTSEDSDTLKDLYSDSNEFYIEMFPMDSKSTEAVMDFESSVAHLQAIKGEIKELQNEQKEIENKIKDLIKDNLGIKTPNYTVSWKVQTTNRLDTIALKENEKELCDKYTVQSSSRVLRIKNNY